MTTRIPTATSITEGAVIPAPLAHVWHLIKLQDFHKFWTKLAKSHHVKGASSETDIVKWTFKDGTEQEVKQEEHSVWISTLGIAFPHLGRSMAYAVCCIGNRPFHHLLRHLIQPCFDLLERHLHYPMLCCDYWRE